MSLPRIFLVLEGLFFALVGAAALVRPAGVANVVDILLPSSTAVVDFMAYYGGFALGTGAFLVWCAIRKPYVPAGLLFLVFAFGATGMARLVGILTQSPAKPVEWQMLVIELLSVMLSLLLLRHVAQKARLG